MTVHGDIRADDQAQLLPFWEELRHHVDSFDINSDGDLLIEIDLTEQVRDDPGLVPVEPEHDLDDEEVPPTPAAVEAIEVEASFDNGGDEPVGSTSDVAPGSCAEAVIELLQAEPDVVFTVADVTDAVEQLGFTAGTIKFTLSDLFGSGKVARAGRGLYRAVER